MPPARYALFTAMLLTGCSQGNFSAAVPLTNVPPISGYTSYHAYGDSITAGAGVANISFVYASLVASYNSLPYQNYAIGGDEACDVPTRQIFAQGDSPALATSGIYSLLVGTNDVDVRGAGAGEATFNLCHQAAISWLATPLEAKVLATSAAVTVTGANHLETQGGFNAVTTDAAGASVSFAFNRTAAAPLHLWYRLNDYIPATFTCALDGTSLATLATAPAVQVQTQNGISNSVGVYRVATVAAGAHVLRCTQNNGGVSGMGLIAIGGPPAAGTAHRPRLLAGLLTPQLNGARASILAAYIADIRANVALFAGDGLDVELFDAAQYMTGTTADMIDSLHPNALGQQEIFQAFEQALK